MSPICMAQLALPRADWTSLEELKLDLQPVNAIWGEVCSGPPALPLISWARKILPLWTWLISQKSWWASWSPSESSPVPHSPLTLPSILQWRMEKVKPDAAHGAGQVPGPVKKSLLVCLLRLPTCPGQVPAGAGQDGRLWNTDGNLRRDHRREQHPSRGPSLASPRACCPETHILEG